MVVSRQLVDVQPQWPGQDRYATPYNSRSQTPRISSRLVGDAPEHRALARTIEGEIIPRLMLAHRIDAARAERSEPKPLLQTGPSPTPDNVTTLATIALDQPVDVGVAYLESMQLKGISAESLFLDVIAPAARLIGELWKSDDRDFTEVTVALTRLQSMMTELMPAFEGQETTRFSSRCALLMPSPGEQHGLGVSMVQKFFRRAGWHVYPHTPENLADLKRVVATQHFDIVGFSASCDVFVDGLKSAISATRKYSRNRNVGIIVGGRAFNENPHLVAAVGADATAADGREAVRRLPALLGMTATAAIC